MLSFLFFKTNKMNGLLIIFINWSTSYTHNPEQVTVFKQSKIKEGSKFFMNSDFLKKINKEMLKLLLLFQLPKYAL